MKNKHVVFTRLSTLFAWKWNCGGPGSNSLPSSEVSQRFDQCCHCESQHPRCSLKECTFLWWPAQSTPSSQFYTDGSIGSAHPSLIVPFCGNQQLQSGSASKRKKLYQPLWKPIPSNSTVWTHVGIIIAPNDQVSWCTLKCSNTQQSLNKHRILFPCYEWIMGLA